MFKQFVKIITISGLMMLTIDSVNAQYGISWSELKPYQKGLVITGGLVAGGVAINMAGSAVAGSLATVDLVETADIIAFNMISGAKMAAKSVSTATSRLANPIQKVKNFRAIKNAEKDGWTVNRWALEWEDELLMTRNV